MPETQVFWRIERGDTLWNIIRGLYGSTDSVFIQQKVQELASLNPHIKNPNVINPGQLLNLGTLDGIPVQVPETDLREMETLLQENSELTSFTVKNMPALQQLALSESEYEAGGPVNECRATPVEIKASLPSDAPVEPGGSYISWAPGLAYKLAKTARHTGARAATGQFGNLLKVSPHVWRQVEGEIVRGAVGDTRYVRQLNGALGLVPRGNRAFGANGRVLLVRPDKSGGFYRFSKQVRLGKDVAKRLLNPAGKILRAVDFGLYVKRMNDAVGTPNQGATMARESGKYVGGLAFSMYAAPAISHGVCALLTFSTGVGGLACYFTVFVASASLASSLSGATAESIYTGVTRILDSP